MSTEMDEFYRLVAARGHLRNALVALRDSNGAEQPGSLFGQVKALSEALDVAAEHAAEVAGVLK